MSSTAHALASLTSTHLLTRARSSFAVVLRPFSKLEFLAGMYIDAAEYFAIEPPRHNDTRRFISLPLSIGEVYFTALSLFCRRLNVNFALFVRYYEHEELEADTLLYSAERIITLRRR